MKLCKDCKYFFKETKFAGNIVYCHHPKSAKNDDPIYGDHSYCSCTTMRHKKGLCGIDGKLWIAAALFTKEEFPSI